MPVSDWLYGLLGGPAAEGQPFAPQPGEFARWQNNRMSDNIEDRRGGIGSGWNAAALRALEGQYGSIWNPPSQQESFSLPDNTLMPRPTIQPTPSQTPANNGIDDLFTHSSQYPTHDPEAWYTRPQQEGAGSTTPHPRLGTYFDPKTKRWVTYEDGSTPKRDPRKNAWDD